MWRSVLCGYTMVHDSSAALVMLSCSDFVPVSPSLGHDFMHWVLMGPHRLFSKRCSIRDDFGSPIRGTRSAQRLRWPKCCKR